MSETPISEWDAAPWYKKWTFSVVNPLLEKGMNSVIDYEDLLLIPKDDYAMPLLEKLKITYRNSKKFLFVPRLLVALIKMDVTSAVIISSYTIIEGIARISLPIVLIFLIRALENTDKDTAFVWAAVLSAIGLIQTVIHHVLFYFSMKTGWNWKNAATAYIHDQLFQMSSSALQNSGTGSGMMVNLISNDVARFEQFAIFAAFTWIAMIEVVVILVLLIYVLDVPSAFAGVGTTVLFIPCMIVIAKRFALYRGETAAATDRRVRHIGEVIDGIASVKSYAWETPFFKLIKLIRKDETSAISKSQMLRAMNQGFSFFQPTLVTFVTFTVFWAVGGTLTLPIIFSAMSLLRTLRVTIGIHWIRSIELGSEAIAACERIERFLSLVDDPLSTNYNQNRCTTSRSAKKSDVGYSLTNVDDAIDDTVEDSKVEFQPEEVASNELIYIKLSSYYYGNDSENLVLKDIELNVSRGELLMIVGPVGCGKSSLLLAALGEMNESTAGQSSRRLASNIRLAYCSQRPWIVAASVRSNISLAGVNHVKDKEDDGFNTAIDLKNPTFLDQDLYRSAVESCLLVDDMIQWPAYDETEVGERGISISGGQKARISLARAVYANADLILLDDPLSAVDAPVGKALFMECINKEMKNKNKGVILVTHQLQYLPYADKVLVLNKDGEKSFYGNYNMLQQNQSVLDQLDLGNVSEHSDSYNNTDKIAVDNDDIAVDSTPKRESYDPNFRAKSKQAADMSKAESVSFNTVTASSTYEETEKEKQRRKIISREDKVEGEIPIVVIWKYFTSQGILPSLYPLFLLMIAQGISMISDYWLQWWASDSFGDQDNSRYVWIFAILTASCVFVGLYRAFAYFKFTLSAASDLQEKSLWAVLHSPISFFTANPTGRILNRFAKDQNQADELLPVTLFDFLQFTFVCISAVVLVCISIPYLILLMPILLYLFYLLRRKYMKSTREIKRMEAVTRSPIYSDFSANLEGLITLRAYKLEQRVSQSFLTQLDKNGRAWYSFLMTSRWLGFRLDLETAVILLFLSFFAVILSDTIDVGLIGFTLVYTLSLSGLFQWVVRQSAEVEAQLTSIERITTYAELPPEAGYATTYEMVNDKTPTQQQEQAVVAEGVHLGHLSIQKLTVKYRLDLDPVIKNLTVDIPAGTKVGICGRTGSGKSSVLLSLLRLNMIVDGDIVLDGTSLLKMDLESARGKVSIIPQDPHLFSGTLRFNLDPFSIYTDEQIWSALKDAHIYEYIKSSDNLGLLTMVEEGGKNFSVGQRQLLSLARAILRQCKVVLMDEVTASIDFITDRLIQTTIRTSPILKNSTIITVAHRLRTIADSDMIVVIEDGVLIEKGNPKVLLKDDNSEFKKFAMESNEFEEIVRIANTNNYEGYL